MARAGEEAGRGEEERAARGRRPRGEGAGGGAGRRHTPARRPPPPRPGLGSGAGPAAGAEQRTRGPELRRGQLRAPRCPALRHRPALRAEGPGLAPPAEDAVRRAPNCSSSPPAPKPVGPSSRRQGLGSNALGDEAMGISWMERLRRDVRETPFPLRTAEPRSRLPRGPCRLHPCRAASPSGTKPSETWSELSGHPAARRTPPEVPSGLCYPIILTF